MSYASLEDALASGHGIERPFCCPVHGDSNASASVNVIKGVWCCYACKATGTVDGKKAPSPELLESMLGKGEGGRTYPESYLELFDYTGDDYGACYWSTRFPAWVAACARLGQDPFTGEATFPVRTPEGVLAGVGRRRNDPDAHPRYVYPFNWSASRVMFAPFMPHHQERVLVIVEGAADAAAIAEVGAEVRACYGSALHLPQREYVARLNPKLVLVAFDNDSAGNAGWLDAKDQLSDLAPIVRVNWEPGGDPAGTPYGDRVSRLHEALARYTPNKAFMYETLKSWNAARKSMIEAYERSDHAP